MVSRNPARDLSALVVGASDCAPTNFTLDIGKHSPVDPKAGDMVADNLTDQSDALVIPINLGGVRGAITARFIDFRSSFHRSIYGD